jgi:hypothetical protein
MYGVCNGRDFAEFLESKLNLSSPGKLIYELMLPENCYGAETLRDKFCVRREI